MRILPYYFKGYSSSIIRAFIAVLIEQVKFYVNLLIVGKVNFSSDVQLLIKTNPLSVII